MFRNVVVFTLLLAVNPLRGDSSDFPSDDTGGPVVVFGNSIAEGFIDGKVDTLARYSSLLAEELARRNTHVTVVNAGVGGDTSRDGYDRLDADVLTLAPRVVTISFGPNDYLVAENGRVNVGVEEYKLYLSVMVERVRGSGTVPLLLTLVPVLPERYYTTHDRSRYEPLGGIEMVWGAYDRAVRQVGTEMGVGVVDLFPAFRDSLDLLLGEDGAHPSRRGHATIAGVLLPYVTGALEQERTVEENDFSDEGDIRDLRVFPNPFHPGREPLVRIAYESLRDGRVMIEVNTLSGRRVAKPIEGLFRLHGEHTEFWDGRDEQGVMLPAGVYLLQVTWSSTTGGRSYRRVKKLAVLR